MRIIIKAVIRIIILVLVIQLLVSLFKDISWVFYNTEQLGEAFFYLGVLPGVDIAGLAILCVIWWKTDWLVKILAGNIDDRALMINTSSVDFITVAIQIIGIYLVVTSIPDFVGLAVYHIQINDKFPGYNLSEFEVQETKQWVITIAIFLIGLLLVSGSKWLVKRIQGTGNSEPSMDAEDQPESRV
jgi:hypothetical protein